MVVPVLVLMAVKLFSVVPLFVFVCGGFGCEVFSVLDVGWIDFNNKPLREVISSFNMFCLVKGFHCSTFLISFL
jgi:hypothetical protein